MIAIADSSPLILLARTGHLGLLHDLFSRVVIPPAVQSEILRGGNRPGATDLVAASWITVQAMRDQDAVQTLLIELGRGEAEVIALAGEMQEPATLLIDDRMARRRAGQRGLLVLGCAGLLLQCKEQGLLPQIRPVLDQLRAVGLYLTDALYSWFLTEAGEA